MVLTARAVTVRFALLLAGVVLGILTVASLVSPAGTSTADGVSEKQSTESTVVARRGVVWF